MNRFPPISRRTSDADLPRPLALAMAVAGLGPVLHTAGNVELASRPLRIAMVGTRDPGDRSRAAMEALAGQLAGRAVIVSGAAWGIDMASHRGALAVGGATIAIVPVGIPQGALDRWRPVIEQLRDDSLLLLVSPFPIHQPYTRTTPVIRNRLIASLSQAVVVGEASASSGTFHCVRFAREIGLPIFLLRDDSIPRDSALEDLHATLLRDGAQSFTVDECWSPGLAERITRVAEQSERDRAASDRSQLSLFDEAGP